MAMAMVGSLEVGLEAGLARQARVPPFLPSFFPLTSAERGAVAENRIGRSLRRSLGLRTTQPAAESDCDSFIQARAPKGRNPTLLAHSEIVFLYLHFMEHYGTTYI